MNEKKDTKPSLLAKFALSPFVQGPFLGATVMAILTPLLKWTNHVYNGEKMVFTNMLSGATAYAASAVPGYAATFAFKALLEQPADKKTKTNDLVTSLVAGGASGFVCTPFEALAQNKQLTKQSSMKETMKMMQAHRGTGSLFQGAASITMREGLWAAVYMSVIPMMSQSLQERGMEKKQADLFSCVTVAGAYGVLSSPLNQLRFRKQLNLTMPSQKKSYLEHAKDIYNQDAKASTAKRVGFFFKAVVPRAVTTTVGAGLLVKGKELYEETVKGLEK